jgi:spermidine synthase
LDQSQYLTESQNAFGSGPLEQHSVQPFVYEDHGMLTLQFQICLVQSEMSLLDPYRLCLAYTRTMMQFLLINDSPKRIDMIGLGGGSMAKWMYRELPDAEITVIEISPEVIVLRDLFHIPQDNDRFAVICADGADYVADCSTSPDVLLVDGFDINCQPSQLCSEDFYDNCYRTLNDDGLLVVNLCGRNKTLCLNRIYKSFQQRCLVVLPGEGTNAIVFATKGENLWSKAQNAYLLSHRLQPRARRATRRRRVLTPSDERNGHAAVGRHPNEGATGPEQTNSLDDRCTDKDAVEVPR